MGEACRPVRPRHELGGSGSGLGEIGAHRRAGHAGCSRSFYRTCMHRARLRDRGERATLFQRALAPDRCGRAAAPGWTLSERSPAVPCQFQLSGQKLDEAAPARDLQRTCRPPAAGSGTLPTAPNRRDDLNSSEALVIDMVVSPTLVKPETGSGRLGGSSHQPIVRSRAREKHGLVFCRWGGAGFVNLCRTFAFPRH
jgi:hypothetical protein